MGYLGLKVRETSNKGYGNFESGLGRLTNLGLGNFKLVLG